MAWWLWAIIGIAGYCICGVVTLFIYTLALPAEDRATDYHDIDPKYVRHVFLLWPYCLLIEAPFDYFSRFLFKTVYIANDTATKIERKTELRRLREMHEVKEEETYPIPHQTVPALTEAQRREIEGMRNTYNIAYGSKLGSNALATDTRSLPGETYQQWAQRVHGGKSE